MNHARSESYLACVFIQAWLLLVKSLVRRTEWFLANEVLLGLPL